MKDTQSQPVASISSFIKGKPPVQVPYHGTDAAPYLTPEYLRGRCSCEYAKSAPNAARVKNGDTIILWDGSNAGEVFLARTGILASTMSLVQHSNHLHPQYFFYALKRWETYLKGQTSGSGIPHVDKEVLGKLEIYIFPREEQGKIAHVLSTVDKAIEETEALIAKQQRIKTGLMQDLLTKGIDENGNLRSEETHEFKDSPLGWIPVEWRVSDLGTALKQAQGLLQTGPFGSQLHASEYSAEGIPVIMPQDISIGEVCDRHIARIPVPRASSLSRHRVKPGDIIFARRGDLSRAATIGVCQEGWVCGTGCFLLRVPENAIDARWLALNYRHQSIQRQVDTNAVGATMPSLNNSMMSQLLIAFPNLSEQRAIALFVENKEKQLRASREYLEKLRALKAALMQDLLTGRKRVTPLLREKEEAHV